MLGILLGVSDDDDDDDDESSSSGIVFAKSNTSPNRALFFFFFFFSSSFWFSFFVLRCEYIISSSFVSSSWLWLCSRSWLWLAVVSIVFNELSWLIILLLFPSTVAALHTMKDRRMKFSRNDDDDDDEEDWDLLWPWLLLVVVEMVVLVLVFDSIMVLVWNVLQFPINRKECVQSSTKSFQAFILFLSWVR